MILPVMAEVLHDPQLLARLQEAVVASEHTHYVDVLERAQQRGELAGPLDPAITHLLLSGLMFAALFVHHRSIDEALLDGIVTAVAAGMRTLAAHTDTARRVK